MQGQKKPLNDKGIQLSPPVMKSWRQAAMQICRTTADTRSLSPEAAIHALLRQERDGIHELWEVFTTDRKRVGRYLHDPKRQACAYLLGFHLTNVARLRFTLDRAQRRANLIGMTSRFSKMRIIDLGCGTGAASVAWLSFLTEQDNAYSGPIELHLVDQRKAFVQAATACIEQLGLENHQLHLRGHQTDIGAYVAKSAFDTEAEQVNIVLMSNLWNEISHHAKIKRQISQWLFRLAASSSPMILIFLDPANQMPSRQAMEFRDTICQAGLTPLYPCPHSQACPMLDRQRDWCYSEGHWHLPKEQIFLDKSLRVNHRVINSSSYIFSNCVPENFQLGQNYPVVVGRPLRVGRQKSANFAAKADLLLCQPSVGLTKTAAPKVNPPSRGELWTKGE